MLKSDNKKHVSNYKDKTLNFIFVQLKVFELNFDTQFTSINTFLGTYLPTYI